MEILSERLLLRPFRAEDWADYHAYFNDPEIWRMMGYHPLSEAELHGDFQWRLENPQKVLALVRRADGRLIGHVVAGDPNPPVRTHPDWGTKRGRSLSFALGRGCRRQGYMTEALRALIDRLFAEDAALEFVNGGWFSFNTASAALHRRLGFRPAFSHVVTRNGEEIETCEGFLTREAWSRERGEQIMFRPMRRIRQQLTEAECLEVLRQEPRGVLAVLGDEGYPYAVPLDFFYHDGKLYFHGAKQGHKLDALRRCDKASFCVMDPGYRREGEWALNIRSVIVFGRVRAMEETEEAAEAMLRQIGLKYFPDPADADRSVAASRGRVQMLEFTIEHMSGKLVNES